ncbi:MAG: hypothetical protein Q4P78_00650 [Rothia sp. (in: high G+C Gram-positive bacteria)]|uniref:hypothetical protein n=1 Tax=Rothia sp. (in: high G+C Gram-positive bacteria) TaxID=1885016 RepID=UPI0026DED49A|nr:hypothetical protein [Rothia sp. (in: high G+C Gram-positive bacteria)]MDO5749699.1 hypothetical protein [Rothia sp. (in: high G+C Gram-positive bacteria)]
MNYFAILVAALSTVILLGLRVKHALSARNGTKTKNREEYTGWEFLNVALAALSLATLPEYSRDIVRWNLILVGFVPLVFHSRGYAYGLPKHWAVLGSLAFGLAEAIIFWIGF